MIGTYWQSRSDFQYYKTIKQLLEDLGPSDLLIDVGGWDTPVATYGTFNERIVVDLRARGITECCVL